MTKSSGNRRCVVKRGGSYSVTIPAAMASQLGIKDHSVLEIETNGRELIMHLVKVKENDDADS